MVWNNMQWYSYSLPFLLMQTFWMDTHWMDPYWWDTCWTDMYQLVGYVLVGYVCDSCWCTPFEWICIEWIRIAWIRIGGIRVEGKGIGGIRIGGIRFEWICVQNRCKPFEWIRIEWTRTGGIRVERIRIGGIRIGGIRFEWICVGYVWCAGYVWDMCGVRYANNLLKNPATKRLSGKKTTMRKNAKCDLSLAENKIENKWIVFGPIYRQLKKFMLVALSSSPTVYQLNKTRLITTLKLKLPSSKRSSMKLGLPKIHMEVDTPWVISVEDPWTQPVFSKRILRRDFDWQIWCPIKASFDVPETCSLA